MNIKSALLCVPFFHTYHRDIENELERQNIRVVTVENRMLPLDPHVLNTRLRFFRKLYYQWKEPDEIYGAQTFDPILQSTAFDAFLCINLFACTPGLLKRIKSRNPSSTMILYLWDTTRVYDKPACLPYFDRIFTFDPEDAARHGWSYLPNFHTWDSNEPDIKTDIDLLFVGTQHSDRYTLLQTLYHQALADGLNTEFHLVMLYRNLLHFPVFYWMSHLWPGERSRQMRLERDLVRGKVPGKFLDYERMDYTEYLELFRRSRCILDIEMPWQSGYSQALILALASGKKVITTNAHIVNEPFYNPNQVQLLSRDNPHFDSDWIQKPFTPDRTAFQPLHISQWIRTLLNED